MNVIYKYYYCVSADLYVVMQFLQYSILKIIAEIKTFLALTMNRPKAKTSFSPLA